MPIHDMLTLLTTLTSMVPTQVLVGMPKVHDMPRYPLLVHGHTAVSLLDAREALDRIMRGYDVVLHPRLSQANLHGLTAEHVWGDQWTTRRISSDPWRGTTMVGPP